MSDAEETVLWSVDNGVATLTLNRPDQLNALTAPMQRRYSELLQRASAEPDVRVVVVTGAGRGFCAGADMNFMNTISSGGKVVDDAGEEETFAEAVANVSVTVPKPVIAAINGPVAGLGLCQALFCDLRFAAEGAKITTAFAHRGLIGEYGIAWVLPRLVGLSRSLDLLLSGRVVLAEEALQLGIVDRVIPAERLLEETYAYARKLAEFSAPRSMAIMKRQVYTGLDQDMAVGMRLSLELMLESLEQPEFEEGVRSYMEKRPPRFPGYVSGEAADFSSHDLRSRYDHS